jgi:hypothetical protein
MLPNTYPAVLDPASQMSEVLEDTDQLKQHEDHNGTDDNEPDPPCVSFVSGD